MATLSRLDTTTASTANGTVYTSASFTPTVGDLLAICVRVTGTGATAPTMTASANGITFTRIFTQASNVSAHQDLFFVADQLVPSSPSAMTVTFTLTSGDTGSGCFICVVGVTGMSKVGSAAVRQFEATDNNKAAGSSVPTATFAAATLTTNPVIGMVGTQASGGTNTAPPTSWTEIYDQSIATPTNGYEVAVRASGHTSATVTWTANSTAGAVAIVEFDASASAISANLTPSTETDAVVTLGRAKSRVLTAVTGTNAAVALVRSKARTATPTTETDTAVPLARLKSRSITPATEADTVITLPRRKSRTIGVTTESDAAVALSGGLVGGTTALNLTPATETDAAVALVRVKRRTITPATETDVVVTVGRRESKTLTPVTETDAAQTLVRRKSRALTPSTETSVAVVLGRVSLRTLTAALETAAAVVLARVKSWTLTPADETDTAVALATPSDGIPHDVTAQADPPAYTATADGPQFSAVTDRPQYSATPDHPQYLTRP